ncbi:MAG: DUF2505 domain-containing protein [Deltaproteobacteria bacterium]|nr:DUF2505 domain-containing protein [Deltaproteobacteria bacterium]
MKKWTLRHEINCSAKQFWPVFFDKHFNETMFLKALGFPEYEIVEQTETDGAVRRIVRARPKMNLPKPLMKLLGDRFGYTEEGSFDPKTEVWSFKMTPSTLAGKLRNEGTTRVEAIDDTRCRRVAELICEVKVFGLGGLLESTSETEMTRGWNYSAKFMNGWIEKHPPE